MARRASCTPCGALETGPAWRGSMPAKTKVNTLSITSCEDNLLPSSSVALKSWDNLDASGWLREMLTSHQTSGLRSTFCVSKLSMLAIDYIVSWSTVVDSFKIIQYPVDGGGGPLLWKVFSQIQLKSIEHKLISIEIFTWVDYPKNCWRGSSKLVVYSVDVNCRGTGGTHTNQ